MVSGVREGCSSQRATCEARALANLSVVPDGRGVGALRTLHGDPDAQRCLHVAKCWALVVCIHLRYRAQMSVGSAGARVKTSCAFDQHDAIFCPTSAGRWSRGGSAEVGGCARAHALQCAQHACRVALPAWLKPLYAEHRKWRF